MEVKISTLIYGVGFNSRGKYSTQMPNERKHTTSYARWYQMINRCYNPKCSEYCRYGAKGITVHKDWHDYQVFAEWFEANYIEGTCLDKDLKGGNIYSADNCVFLTPQKNSEIAKSKHYDFISPTGTHTQVYNLQKFCRDNNLDPGGMRHVNSGKRKSHKGWTKLTLK